MFSEFSICDYNDNFNCVRLTDIFESFDDMVFIFDENGRILKANSSATKKLEYRLDELESLNMIDIRGERYKEEVEKKIIEVFSGITSACEIPLMTKSGKEIPILAKIHLGKLSFSGKKIAYAFCEDLSKIRNYENKLNKIFNSNAYSVSVSEIETGILIDVNDKFIKTLGFSREESIGKKSTDLGILTIKDREKIINELKLNGTIKNFDLKYGIKNGEIRDGEFSGDIINMDGKDYLMLIVIDITEKKENIENYMALLNAIPYLMIRIRYDNLILDLKPGDDNYLNNIISKDLIGKDIRNLPFEEYVIGEIIETMKKVVKTGEMDEHQYSIKISGMRKYFSVRTAKNGIDEVIIMIRDTTDEINLSNELRVAKEHAENLIQISNAIVIELDKNFNILKFNESAEKITGYEKEEIIGKNWFDVMIPFDKKPEMLKFIKKIINNFSEEDKIHENEIITKNGKRKYISWRNNCVLKNKEFISMTSFGIDMTDRKIFEEKLLESKNRAEESDKMKLEFLANMSHDLRTPMNAIIGFSDLLKTNNLSKSEKTDYINTIINNGKFLMTLIDDIIDVSKIDTHSLKIENRNFEINKLLEELRLSYTKQIRDKKIEIVIEEDVNKNVILYTDKYRIRQILMNLIGNAIKFTKEGYVKFGYKIIDNKKLEMFVEDTGIGVAKENQEMIFERFKQLNNNGSKFKGAGLGLSITKSLIKLLEFDDIKLKSELGKGSKFYFTVPYTIINFDYVEHSKNRDDNKPINLKGKTILIAEDDRDSRYIISKHLFKTNVRIIECSDGNRVMDIIKTNRIDLVLLDIGLPNKTGYQLIKEIKEYDNRMPIIIESALAMPDQKSKAYDLGCDDYITKPFSQNDLLYKIDRLI